MEASNLTRWRLTAIAVAALALAAGLISASAGAARAASAQGGAEIRLAQHEQGRTLSGQSVRVVASGSGASNEAPWLKLLIDRIELGEKPGASTPASLSFHRAGKSVALTDLRFDLAAGTLNGKLGGEEMAVFRQGAPSQVDAGAGSVGVQGGKLLLIRDAARLLRSELGLPRALLGKGVGMIWMAAQADPTRVERPVEGGGIEWGVLASWRAYVLGHQGPPFPPFSNGTISVAGGATANGDLEQPAGFFSFPANGGSFGEGLYGASDRLVLHTQGSVTFSKPAHCIVEVELADLTVTLDGPDSALELDSVYDIDVPEGSSCGPLPPVASENVEFARLDLSGVAPARSGDTIVWSDIPTTLTEAGAEAFGTGYPAGQELDPVTIAVTLG